MNLKRIKKLVEKWIKWSGEKQLKVFLSNKKTTKMFEKIASESVFK